MTTEMEFPDELIDLEKAVPVEELLEEPEEFTPMADEIVAAALAEIRSRSFFARNPHLGKMINCQVCGTRHRQNERKCEQKFTYVVGDYEVFREGENGELIPDYRTAIPADSKPTMKQVMGSAAFAKKRFNPHHSKIKLQFIERVRVVFDRIDQLVKANLSRVDDADLREKLQETYDSSDMFKELLQRCRVVAARELRKERREQSRRIRKQQRHSRKINRDIL